MTFTDKEEWLRREFYRLTEQHLTRLERLEFWEKLAGIPPLEERLKRNVPPIQKTEIPR